MPDGENKELECKNTMMVTDCCKHLEALFLNHPYPVFLFDCKGILRYQNVHGDKLLGSLLMNKSSIPFYKFVAKADIGHMKTILRKVQCGLTIENEWVRIVQTENNPLLICATTIPILKSNTVIGSYVIVTDFENFGYTKDVLYQLTRLDILTQLPNRISFVASLAEMLSQKMNEHTVYVLLMDLDRFKFVNETLGHSFGDKLLKKAALRIKDCIPEKAILARMGGDEFGICVSKHTKDEIIDMATRILQSFQAPFYIEGQEVYAPASIGIVSYPEHGPDVEALMKHADTAMYVAKTQGKNNIQWAATTNQAGSLERINLETMLRHALLENQFVVYYQPKVDTLTKQVVGLEALVRWLHPLSGMIYPNAFISLAEETGLIVPLGKLVLRMVCAQLRNWMKEGISVQVSVNISSRQFQQSDFVDMIKELLEESRINPSLLEVEITENTAMENVERAIQLLEELHAIGIKISIDDFGTGYSSLSYLTRFPIHTLKVDRSFILGIDTGSEYELSVISTIISLAKALHLRTVAEGVENELQYQFLLSQGCDQIQGFLFGKPMSAAIVETILDHPFTPEL